MQRYRFIIRHDHEEHDSALALSHIEVLKAEMDSDSKQSVFHKDRMPSAASQNNGEVLILVATQEEKDGNKKFADYEKA